MMKPSPNTTLIPAINAARQAMQRGDDPVAAAKVFARPAHIGVLELVLVEAGYSHSESVELVKAHFGGKK